jgi:hypothetical protein
MTRSMAVWDDFVLLIFLQWYLTREMLSVSKGIYNNDSFKKICAYSSGTDKFYNYAILMCTFFLKMVSQNLALGV